MKTRVEILEAQLAQLANAAAMLVAQVREDAPGQMRSAKEEVREELELTDAVLRVKEAK